MNRLRRHPALLLGNLPENMHFFTLETMPQNQHRPHFEAGAHAVRQTRLQQPSTGFDAEIDQCKAGAGKEGGTPKTGNAT